MYQDMADQLWELAYHTFERRPGDGFRTAWGTKQMTNDVQFRMMQNIAALKTAPDETAAQKFANDVWADVMVSHANAWMTDETAQKMQDVIGTILPVDQPEA